MASSASITSIIWKGVLIMATRKLAEHGRFTMEPTGHMLQLG